MKRNAQEHENRINEAIRLIDRMTDEQIMQLLCIFALENETAS